MVFEQNQPWLPVYLSGRRSPRVRHGIRKPRPSSVELTNDLKDMSEGEDVFYTYRASVSSSKDSEGDASPQQLVSVTAEMVSIHTLNLPLSLVAFITYVREYVRGESFN